MNTPRVLLVDDDTALLESLARGLTASGITAPTIAAANAQRALELLRLYSADVAIIDLSLNQVHGVESGYSLLQDILCHEPNCRVIVLTGSSETEFGVRALSLGAAHFIAKPPNLPHLAALVCDGLNQARLRRELSRFQNEQRQELMRKLVGKSAAACWLRDEISHAAATQLSVFIRGESGTGKGLCAQLIHQLSESRPQAFVRYQPIFGSPDLANSDLFGHRKGAFTGAVTDRTGLLHCADGGTLFLDEVDELPRETQIALLGVLHDRVYRMLGDNQTQRSTFRLISASNALIEQKIDDGSFRRDLFHRIAHHQITIPPLRERTEDISELTRNHIDLLRNRGQIRVHDLSPKALQLLEDYCWPGNIRELEAVIEGALWRAQNRESQSIDTQDIELARSHRPAMPPKANFHEQMRAFEHQLVSRALRENSGSLSAAARALGIDRGTVKRITERNRADITAPLERYRSN